MGPRRRSRQRTLEIAYASQNAVSDFLLRYETSQTTQTPAASCVLHRRTMQPSACSGNEAARADRHTMSTPYAAFGCRFYMHPSLVRRAGHLVQARVMTLFGLSAADPRGNLERVAAISTQAHLPILEPPCNATSRHCGSLTQRNRLASGF